MTETSAQRRATLKYRKANVVNFTVALNVKSDADVIAHLGTDAVISEGKAAYLRRLIREDMARNVGYVK